jgi:hypothetical protein
MELVPFSSSVAGLGLLILGLSLVAHDGLLALLAIVIFGGAFSFLIIHLL